MSLLYADYSCPECGKCGKLIHELQDNINEMVIPGQRLKKELELKAECEYCNKLSDAIAKSANGLFVGFVNASQSNLKEYNVAPDTNTVFDKWKKEKTFSPIERVDFDKQPYKSGMNIKISGESYNIKRIFRTEWIEKDLDLRIELPRPDTYWYEAKDRNNTTKWIKVENVEGENVFVSDDGIVVLDLKEKVEEMTDSPQRIEMIFQSDWFGGREIEAFQYINGVRILVLNHKKQVEMDIFQDTLEEAMAKVEENIELGVFNE